MPAPSEEAALLERIRRDEPGAFEEFVGRWQDRIYAFGLRMCGEREDALDVLQETLLAAYRSLKTLENPEALKAWVFRVAANACLMKRRKGKYEPEGELSLEELVPREAEALGPPIPDPGALPEEDVARRRLQETVRRAILELPPQYRIVLALRDLEELSTRETVEILGLEPSAVKMRLHRARLMLRKKLQDALRPATGQRP